VIFRVDATINVPVRFNGHEYIRVGSALKSLANYQERAKFIWNRSQEDWSAQTVDEASLGDLDPAAFTLAREAFKEKHQNAAFYGEIDNWDDWTFLRKAGLASEERLNRAAILLLGKPESAMLLSPHVSQSSWILKDTDGIEMDYQHFAPPFLSNVDRLFARIRNLTIRELPGGTLFPVEISQYDEWVIREALHNCIVHQDYTLCSRIIVVEQPDGLLFVNAGQFIPGVFFLLLKLGAQPPVNWLPPPARPQAIHQRRKLYLSRSALPPQGLQRRFYPHQAQGSLPRSHSERKERHQGRPQGDRPLVPDPGKGCFWQAPESLSGICHPTGHSRACDLLAKDAHPLGQLQQQRTGDAKPQSNPGARPLHRLRHHA